jgi:predicted phosphodiesterase
MILIAFITSASKPEKKVSFGLFADCQYCDCETRGSRFYRNSLAKLQECIDLFNTQDDLEFVAGLGDLIDRDYAGFEKINSVLSRSEHDIKHVLGNHDYEVEQVQIDKVAGILGLSSGYYSFNIRGWKFIFLNGNDITFKSADPGKIVKAKEMTQKIKEVGGPNYYEWNGGLGKIQLKWLDRQLKEADRKRLNAVLFCHYPVVPLEAHTLWNHHEVLEILRKHDSVKLWINGHNHAGGCEELNGIHFITLKGMVETENENAFARITLTNNSIKVTGYGREENRELTVK